LIGEKKFLPSRSRTDLRLATEVAPRPFRVFGAPDVFEDLMIDYNPGVVGIFRTGES
jgi:hypothetical protein